MSAWGNSPELEAQARGTVSMMDELLHDQPKAIATEVPYAARAFTTRDIYWPFVGQLFAWNRTPRSGRQRRSTPHCSRFAVRRLE